jgi:hypothetical protein
MDKFPRFARAELLLEPIEQGDVTMSRFSVKFTNGDSSTTVGRMVSRETQGMTLESDSDLSEPILVEPDILLLQRVISILNDDFVLSFDEQSPICFRQSTTAGQFNVYVSPPCLATDTFCVEDGLNHLSMES